MLLPVYQHTEVASLCHEWLVPIAAAGGHVPPWLGDDCHLEG
jgi:hypothetical protein